MTNNSFFSSLILEGGGEEEKEVGVPFDTVEGVGVWD